VLWTARHAISIDGKRLGTLLDDDVEELGRGSILNSTKVKIRRVE